jgi:hypothetical protein
MKTRKKTAKTSLRMLERAISRIRRRTRPAGRLTIRRAAILVPKPVLEEPYMLKTKYIVTVDLRNTIHVFRESQSSASEGDTPPFPARFNCNSPECASPLALGVGGVGEMTVDAGCCLRRRLPERTPAFLVSPQPQRSGQRVRVRELLQQFWDCIIPGLLRGHPRQ